MKPQVEILVNGILSGNTPCTGSLDLFDNEPISLNMAVADVRDIKRKTSTYSQSFVLPATRNNNKLFNFIFEIGSDSTFNPAIKTPCQILVDTIPVVSNGILQLLAINVDDQKNITYMVNIYDQTGDVINAIGDKLLTDINFSTLTHRWNAGSMLSSWTGSSQPYFYPLIDYGYDFTVSNMNPTGGVVSEAQLFPATQVYTILENMFEQTGYTFTSEFFETPFFQNLYIPFVGTSGLSPTFSSLLTYRAGLVSGATDNFFTIGSSGSQSFRLFFENTTAPSFFNNTTGGTSASYVNASSEYSANTEMNVQFQVSIDFEITGTTSVSMQLYAQIEFYRSGYLSGSVPYDTQNLTNLYIPYMINVSGPLTFGPVTSIPLTASIFSTQFGPSQIGETFWCKLKFTWNSTLSNNIDFKILPSPPGGTYFQNIVNWSLVENQVVPYNFWIPNNIKQIDFLQSIITMFNLYVEADKLNPHNLIIEPRDAFYSGGTVWNWSKKLDVSQPVNEVLLSEQTNQRLVFSYKPDVDYYNNNYTQATNRIFGDNYYTINNQFVKDDYDINVIFSPTPSVAVAESGGFVPPNLNNSVANEFVIPKIGALSSNNNWGQTNYNIRILQKNAYNLVPLTGGDKWTLGGIYDTFYSASTFTSYPYLGMLDHPSTGTTDLGFGTVLYEYYALSAITNNNLVNTYWANYLQQVQDTNGKLITCSIYLTPEDIQSFSFRDTIFLDGLTSEGMAGYFLVNSIVYDPTVNAPSKVELIQVPNEYVISEAISIGIGNITNIIGIGSSNLSNTITLGGASSQATTSIAMGPNTNIGPSSSSSIAMGNGNMILGGSQHTVAIGSGNTINGFSPNSHVHGNNNHVSIVSYSSHIIGNGNKILT